MAVLPPASLLPISLAAQADTTAQPANVSVNFLSFKGEYAHSERYNNFTNYRAFPAQRPADVAYLNVQGLHGSAYRVWLDPSMCGMSTTTCTLSSDVNTYLTAGSDVSDAMLANLNVTSLIDPSRTGGTMSPAQVKPIVKTLLETVKANYPKLRYVEAFNEPDAPQYRGFMTPALVYPYYQVFYQAVNEINAELHPAVRLRIGGPAFFEFDPTWFGKFLDDYAADPSSDKRLDFFSYHGYVRFGDEANLTNPQFYKDAPNQVAGQRSALEAMLKARSLNPNVPSFITETGMYPGPLCDDCSTSPYYTADYIRQAAGMAALEYWYNQQPRTVMFNWVTRHSSNERKDQFVTRVPAGQTTPTNIFTPYGNMLLMQSMMKTVQVSATSDSINDKGMGVYATASEDLSGASVMVWNYQSVNSGRFSATVTMKNLPLTLAYHPVNLKVFRIDQNTSNYYSTPATDPAHASLQQVDTETVTPGLSYSQTLDLEPNALYLVLLEPAAQNVGRH